MRRWSWDRTCAPLRGVSRLGLLPLSLAATLLVLVLPASGRAATFTVTKTTDTADGICDADCSLREAVIAANALLGADTVVVPAGTYTLTIPGASENAAATGDLDVSDALTISGAGSGSTTINGGGLDRVLDASLTSLPVAISGVTLTGGSLGAAETGGGINHSSGAITVTDAVIAGNSAGFGGGIDNSSGTMTLTNVTISGNTAGRGGGVRNSSADMTFTNVAIAMNTASSSGGGGISNSSGDLTLVTSSITGNTSSGPGGGIETSTGVFVITDSSIANNTASGATADGGAIFTSSTNVTISGSTFSGNSAGDDGGVFFNSSGTWTITNSTFSGNSAGDQGGAFSFEGGTWTVTNVTLSGNSASEGGGLFLGSGTVTLRNTILANAPSENCFQSFGTLSSSGNNLSNDTTCAFALTASGDLNNTDPMLGPLASNGGPTQTHALLGGSPAIDAAGGCPPPATDQRGVVRPQGPACDIGSFELQGGVETPTLTPTVTPTGAPPTVTPTLTPVPGAPPTDIPTLSWPLLVLLALGLAGVGLFVLKGI
ncbi:MAG: choice-of-anchor Q domain-containing protein [Thermoanaerobaculia bacterium]